MSLLSYRPLKTSSAGCCWRQSLSDRPQTAARPSRCCKEDYWHLHQAHPGVVCHLLLLLALQCCQFHHLLVHRVDPGWLWIESSQSGLRLLVMKKAGIAHCWLHQMTPPMHRQEQHSLELDC